MEKKKLARIRNWNKARLVGQFKLNNKGLTKKEKEIYREIGKKVKELVANWDLQTRELGLNVGKRYKVVDKKSGKTLTQGYTKKEIKEFGILSNDPEYVIKEMEI